ncbi:hypothetical protein [Pseudomonas aeruginosa]|uniref:hypothetical protein n=1 Tax=Pseudomonas aeruginosa TaxID=287 RepID=UPI0025B38E78|nr:hypothetical protein [Pseudomonas aeruginosa]MDN3924887.1 hypothetical protein [Pseudomonas aeruginosa]MDQ9135267.1 hypothetical protein [Pseudomonas aeruginosa]
MIKNDSQAPSCTCPSGDGSLRHPCPAHPAVEQAGANVGHGHVLPRADGVKMRCGGPGLCSECTADASRARAALAQPSPASDLDPLNLSPHAKAFNEAPAEALKSEQPEAERPELWAVHAQGPDELYAAFTREDADKHAAELNALPMPEGITVDAVVVSSPWPPAEHWQYLAEQERDHKNEIAVRLRQFERLEDQLKVAQAEVEALRAELQSQRERNTELIFKLGSATNGWGRCEKERDAAQAKLAELEKQEPVAAVSEETFSANGTSDIITRNLPIGTTLYAAPVAPAQHSVPQAWLDVQAERRRQITAEGWTPEHDDEHSHGQIARAAACYALAGSSAPNDGTAALLVSLAWPWDQQWWKPTSARRDLIKAGALILAEIERLDRAAPGKEVGHE